MAIVVVNTTNKNKLLFCIFHERWKCAKLYDPCIVWFQLNHVCHIFISTIWMWLLF